MYEIEIRAFQIGLCMNPGSQIYFQLPPIRRVGYMKNAHNKKYLIETRLLLLYDRERKCVRCEERIIDGKKEEKKTP